MKITKNYKLIILIILVIFIYAVIQIYINNKVELPFYRKKSKLKVMTYNIKHGEKIEQNNLDSLKTFLAENRADIIALNEVDSRKIRSGLIKQDEELAKELKMNNIFGATLNNGIGEYGNAILTVYEVLNSRNYLLPKYPNNEQRALLEVEVNIPELGQVLLMVTHLSNDAKQRAKEIDWIEKHLEKVNKPFILMGDMNHELKALSGIMTLNQNTTTYPSLSPKYKLDHIFYGIDQKLKDDDYKFITVKSELSDHLPFIVEINLNS